MLMEETAPSPKEFKKIGTCSFDKSKILGKGSYGDVYLGYLHDEHGNINYFS